MPREGEEQRAAIPVFPDPGDQDQQRVVRQLIVAARQVNTELTRLRERVVALEQRVETYAQILEG